MNNPDENLTMIPKQTQEWIDEHNSHDFFDRVGPWLIYLVVIMGITIGTDYMIMIMS